MNIQRKHLILWVAALLLILCAWTVTASAAIPTPDAQGFAVDYEDADHPVLIRYEGTATTITAKDCESCTAK